MNNNIFKRNTYLCLYFKEGSNVSLAEYSNIGPGLKVLLY